MRSRGYLFALMLAGLPAYTAFAGETAVASTSVVEAAFLYNFALFTEWPALPGKEFRICVLGSEDMIKALAPLREKQLKELPVSITTLDSKAHAQSCQVLFVGRSRHASIAELARQIGNAPVMMVSEENSYDPKHVTISLVEQQGKLAFKINLTAAQASSLALSSKLLKLAKQVY